MSVTAEQATIIVAFIAMTWSAVCSPRPVIGNLVHPSPDVQQMSKIGLTPAGRMSILGIMSAPDYIQSAEAAALLGYSQRTFNRKVAAGEIPSVAKLDGPTGPRLFERSVISGLAAALKEAS